jgi:hypothetical protein
MGLSVADIVAKFPVKTLPIITGEPDYATIGQIIQTLYGNAASLPTTIGGGAHGHIGLIMTTVLYATLTPTAYTVPDDPGPVVTHAANAPPHPSVKETPSHTRKQGASMTTMPTWTRHSRLKSSTHQRNLRYIFV